MLVIFKIFVMLNVITFELVNLETVFTVLFPRDVTPSILAYCAIVSMFKAEKFLENVGSMFLSIAFVPMNQSTRRRIPNDCVVNTKGKGQFGVEGGVEV
jgi:hypothetical protein